MIAKFTNIPVLRIAMIKFKSIKENQIGKRGKALNLAQDFKAGQTLAHLIVRAVWRPQGDEAACFALADTLPCGHIVCGTRKLKFKPAIAKEVKAYANDHREDKKEK